MLGLSEGLGVNYQPVEGEPAGPASGAPSALRLEMRYDTWGTCGQHLAQHPLFLLGGRLLTADEAVEEGICQVEIQDNHSRRNAHYYRVYTLTNRVDAIVLFKCSASSRNHRSEVTVIFGDVSVRQEVDDGCLDGYVIAEKWFLYNCQRGARPRIISYAEYLQKKEIERRLKEAKRLEEERKKTMPRISITANADKLIVSGETFYARDAIKLVAAELGGRALWDSTKKVWIIVGSIDKNAFTAKLKELIPGVVIG